MHAAALLYANRALLTSDNIGVQETKDMQLANKLVPAKSFAYVSQVIEYQGDYVIQQIPCII